MLTSQVYDKPKNQGNLATLSLDNKTDLKVNKKIRIVFVGILILANLLLSTYAPRQTDNHTKPYGSPDDVRNSGSLFRTPFTTDELRYVLYGEGDAVVSSRDPRYLNYIRSLIARPVPRKTRQVNVSAVDAISAFVDKRLKGRKHGFHVECGAAKGDRFSTTLFLEERRNWTGLLIEANQRFVRHLFNTNRQAYMFSGCLSPHKRPALLAFRAAGYQGGLRDYMGRLFNGVKAMGSSESLDLTYCVPLGDLLAALGVNHVDFLSLDTQGSELEILKTLNMDEIRIDMIITEAATERSVARLREFFKETGKYRELVTDIVEKINLIMERNDLD